MIDPYGIFPGNNANPVQPVTLDIGDNPTTKSPPPNRSTSGIMKTISGHPLYHHGHHHQQQELIPMAEDIKTFETGNPPRKR